MLKSLDRIHPAPATLPTLAPTWPAPFPYETQLIRACMRGEWSSDKPGMGFAFDRIRDFFNTQENRPPDWVRDPMLSPFPGPQFLPKTQVQFQLSEAFYTFVCGNKSAFVRRTCLFILTVMFTCRSTVCFSLRVHMFGKAHAKDGIRFFSCMSSIDLCVWFFPSLCWYIKRARQRKYYTSSRMVQTSSKLLNTLIPPLKVSYTGCNLQYRSVLPCTRVAGMRISLY